MTADRIGWAFLALVAGVLAVYVLAAVIGVPPSYLFRPLFEAAGFTAGCVALLVILYQITRR